MLFSFNHKTELPLVTTGTFIYNIERAPIFHVGSLHIDYRNLTIDYLPVPCFILED